MQDESSGDELQELSGTDAYDRPGFLQPVEKEFCDLSLVFVACHYLLNADVELRDSFYIIILCGQYTEEFMLVFLDILEGTGFCLSLLLFLFAFLRSINFAIRVTVSTLRVFLLRLLLRLRLRWLDPEDDPDDDALVSEFEFDDELESEEELSGAELDDELEAESDELDEEELEERFDVE